MTSFLDKGRRFRLTDPALAPNVAGYLWNPRMMIQMACKGYAVSQYMDPEPRKYAHVPNLAINGFMQPEQPYFEHHPGRFFYIRDNDTGGLFSAPYAPVCARADKYEFEQGISDISWLIEQDGIRIELWLSLTEKDILELWSAKVTNLSGRPRRIAFIPYFPVGYVSWMNQGGHFDEDLNAAICTSITGYQRTEQYFENQHLKDLTFLAASRRPDFHELQQAAFEGEGGLRNPDALQDRKDLANGEALYEIPACIMQWNLALAVDGVESFDFIFGPAKDKDEIARLKRAYLDQGLDAPRKDYEAYVQSGLGDFEIQSPDEDFNAFVNHWLPRQIFYHGDSNRLSTDPQTRNYLQDSIGMMFIRPEATRAVLLRTASQQETSGKVPDGILLSDKAQLKYINQVPHSDHAVWFALTAQAYLDETGDSQILQEKVRWDDSETEDSLFDHICKALDFLLAGLDPRGLPLIEQGDWCDPMNMVGLKGKGVSGWLAEAFSFGLSQWARICAEQGEHGLADKYHLEASQMNERINRYFWDGNWYGRGITDDDVLFGVSADKEGRIFINAQSWALLSGAADEAKKTAMLQAIDEQLDTPFGTMMCAPAYTAMREDIGRVTQKWPGNGENGSVYNHAAIFYAAALYHVGETNRAFRVIQKMLTKPDEADIRTRGQLPIFIPNYYRGAYYQHPRTAGRSSNLFNTGTVAWVYRLVIEQMCGIRGEGDAILIDPQIPDEWDSCRFSRTIRGATFKLDFKRTDGPRVITINGTPLEGNCLTDWQTGQVFQVSITGC